MAIDPVMVNGNHHQANGESLTTKTPPADQRLDIKKGIKQESYSNNHTTLRKRCSLSKYLGR